MYDSWDTSKIWESRLTCFILDFSLESILGTSMPKIVQASAIKLNCDTERMRDGYSKVLNQLCNRHRIFSKLVKLKKNCDNLTVAEF